MTKVETTTHLNPEALKVHRKRAGLSQQGLADQSKISKSQISRWERGKQIENIHSTSRHRLCRALNVRWEALTQAPQPANLALLLNRVPYKGDIAGPARTALTYMQLRYRLREQDIIDLAPLAFLILAERGLQTRKAALEETVQALEAATGEACRRLPYLRGAFYDGYDYDWISTERTSLETREVYEHYVDSEGEEISPFVDFLEKELEALALFEKDPIKLVPHYRGAPEYAIPEEYLGEVLGLDVTVEADLRLVHRIQDGRIELREALHKKRTTTHDEFRLWLSERTQAVEQAIEQMHEAQMAPIISGLQI